MDRGQLTDLVHGTIADVLGVEPGTLNGDTNLLVELQVDSLELMEIGTRLETALNTRLDVRDLSGIRTVNQAVDLILTATNGRA